MVCKARENSNCLLAMFLIELFHYIQIHFCNTDCDISWSYELINTGGVGGVGSWRSTLNGKCSYNQKNISSCDNAGQEGEREPLFLQRITGCRNQPNTCISVSFQVSWASESQLADGGSQEHLDLVLAPP